LFLLGEESGSQLTISTFSKKFVREVRSVVSYYFSLEKLIDLGEQFIFYCMKELELKPN